MNIIQEIKALWTARKVGIEIYKEALTMDSTTTKPGWKTTEFWMNAAGQLATLWGAVSGFIPPKYAAIISTVGIAVYTIARTVIKAVSDVKSVQSDTSITSDAIKVPIDTPSR